MVELHPKCPCGCRNVSGCKTVNLNPGCRQVAIPKEAATKDFDALLRPLTGLPNIVRVS